MYEDLRGKTALITGAGKETGIGYAIATNLAKCGVNVVISDLVQTEDVENPLISSNRDEMARLVENLTRQFEIKAIFVDVDVTRNASIKQMVDTIAAQFDDTRT